MSSSPAELAVWNDDNASIPGIELIPRGMARTDASGALLLHRGRFVLERAGALWSRSISSGITIEMLVCPATDRLSGPATILSLGTEKEIALIRIVQLERSITAFVADEKDLLEVDFARAPPNQALHCALEFDGIRWSAYLNGKASESKAGLSVTLDSSAALSLGGTLDGASDWEGAITSVSVYGGARGADVIAADAAAALRKIANVPTTTPLIVNAVLTAKSPVPSIAQLAPYSQSLAIYEYRVKNVLAGSYGHETLYVAHWLVLDGTRLSYADVDPGGTYTLTLEPFMDQSQLESENLSDTVVEDFSLPLWYDAGGTSLGIDAKASARVPVPPQSRGTANSGVR